MLIVRASIFIAGSCNACMYASPHPLAPEEIWLSDLGEVEDDEHAIITYLNYKNDKKKTT